MKVLLINEAFYPDVVATAQHLTDLGVRLASLGHEVTAVASIRGYANQENLYLRYEEYSGVKINRIASPVYNKRSKISRIVHTVIMNSAYLLYLIGEKRHDVVVALTSPPLVGFIAMVVSKIKKSKFCYWIMDINPDEAVAAGWIKPNSMVVKIFDWFLKRTLEGSDQIIVLDEFMKKRIASKSPKVNNHIEVFSPWFDNEVLKPVEHHKNPFREKYRLQGKFVVMYSGNHSVCHPLETILEASLSLKSHPEIMFVFIGGGERVCEVSEYKTKNQLNNIIQLPYQQREDLKYSLSAADVHLVVMGDAFSGIVHPSKIYGILQIGKPFIYVGSKDTCIGQIINQNQIGYQIDHGDAESFVKTVVHLSSIDSAEKKTIMDKAQAVAAKYSKDKVCLGLALSITSGEKNIVEKIS